MKQREREIEKPTAKYSKKYGWVPRKQQGQGDRGKFDHKFLKPPGRIIFIEFKRPGAKPTELQLIEQELLIKMGFIAVFIDNIEEGELLFDFLEHEFAWEIYNLDQVDGARRFNRLFRNYVKEKEDDEWGD